MGKPKVLFYDLETAPNLAWIWGKYEQNAIAFAKEWELLSIAYKWLGSDTVHCHARCDYSDKTDRRLVAHVHRLFQEADILVAHNGDQFDLRKMNARFLYHGMKPPKIPATIDTKKIAKRHFALNSNSLDDIGAHLKLGRKVKHTGFDLWLGCMNGERSAWSLMKKYNKQDVILLEKVYHALLPWIRNHPNLARLRDEKDGCPNCGGGNIKRKGVRANSRTLQQQWNCNDCFSWFLTALNPHRPRS